MCVIFASEDKERNFVGIQRHKWKDDQPSPQERTGIDKKFVECFLVFHFSVQCLVMQCTESRRMWTMCLEESSSVPSLVVSVTMYVSNRERDLPYNILACIISLNVQFCCVYWYPLSKQTCFVYNLSCVQCSTIHESYLDLSLPIHKDEVLDTNIQYV